VGVQVASRLSGLPELDGVRKLWFSDWYDGPVTGIARYGEGEYWFAMVTDDDPVGSWDFDSRVYVLHRLPVEQLADAWRMHRSFAAAGFPGCLHSPPCATTGDATAATVDALRKRWPPEHESGYSDSPPIGWFRE
jgi:hypothetical protein